MDCRRKWTALRSGVGGVVVVLGLTAGAIADPLPSQIRTGNAATVKSAQDAIDKYIQTRLATLADPTAPRQKETRDELVAQVEQPSQGGAGVAPSGPFQTAYVDAVNRQLQVLLSGDAASRVNAAIIVYRLAQSTQSPQLQPTIVKLLNDESPAVALWGAKAAGALLPSILSVPFNAANEQLTKGVIAAVGKHGSSGAVVQEAYAALDVSGLPNRNPPINLPKPMIEKCVKATLEVMRIRINTWTKIVPPDPHADSAAVVYVSNPNILAATPSLRLATTQHLLDLMSVAVARAGMTSGADRNAIINGPVNASISAMVVLLQVDNKPSVATQFNSIRQRLGSMSQAELERDVKAAAVAVRAQQDYSTLKEPPPVEQAAAQ